MVTVGLVVRIRMLMLHHARVDTTLLTTVIGSAGVKIFPLLSFRVG